MKKILLLQETERTVNGTALYWATLCWVYLYWIALYWNNCPKCIIYINLAPSASNAKVARIISRVLPFANSPLYNL